MHVFEKFICAAGHEASEAVQNSIKRLNQCHIETKDGNLASLTLNSSQSERCYKRILKTSF